MEQGIQVTDEQLADGTIARALQAGRSEQVWVQDMDMNLPMLMVFSKNPDPDVIKDVEHSSLNIEHYSDLSGRELDKPQKGINIIRFTDGTSKKMLVK